MTSTPYDASGRALRWALHSKHPGQLEDYGILADSTRGRDVRELALLIRRSLPGTPKNTDSGHDGLPWVTFAGSGHVSGSAGGGSAGGGSAGGGGTGERLGVSVTEWKPRADRARVEHEKDIAQDKTGRPITATRYFDVPFEGPGDAQPGYREIYAAVRGIELPLAQDVVLPLPAANLTHLADDIEGLDFEWVATLAALLLERPVMIISDSPPPFEARIRCLDAVAALLPYGLRADLVAGTWTPNSATHDIRLAFADWANPDQYQVAWQIRPDPAGFTEPTTRYLEHLRRLREKRGTEALVQYLWRLTTPLSPGASAADTVLGYLEKEDEPYTVAVRITVGKAAAGEARTVLERTDPASLEPKIRRVLLERLAAEGTTQDRALLHRLWSDEVFTVLVLAAVQAPSEELAVSYAALAASQEESARFCRAVVESVAKDPDPARKVRVGRVVGSVPPPADGEPELHAALLESQTLCLELIIRALEAGASGCLAWVRWLGRGPATPGWLRPFVVAADVSVPLDSGEAQSAAFWDARGMLALLEFAHSQATIPAVLPAIWVELMRTVQQAEGRPPVVAFLAELPAQPGATQALIDVLLALCESGEEPRGPASEPDSYVATVADLVRRIPPEPRRVVIVRLVYGLTNPPPRQAGIALAVALAEQLRPHQRYVLMGVQPAIEAAPRTLRDLPKPLQQELLEMSPALAARSLLDQLADAIQAGVGDDEIVDLWAEGIRQKCSSKEIVRVLRRWPGAADPRRVYLVIQSLPYTLDKAHHRNFRHEVQSAHEAVLRGELGRQIAAEYRELLESIEDPLRLHTTAVYRALRANRLPSLERFKVSRRRRQ